MHMVGRRLLLATSMAILAGAATVPPLTAAADPTAPPRVTGTAPRVLVHNGKPLQLTITGANLATVNQIFLTPVVADRSFIAYGDSTLLVTLPADLAPGDYEATAVSPAGSSNAGNAEFTVVLAAAPAGAAAGPPAAPRYSFAPMPQSRYEPQTGVVDAGTTVRHATAPAPAPLNPLLLLPLGILLGGLGYLLWGRPGRLATADRQGLAAQLVGRPAQALHIGRICLQCGRLHFVLRTRRDLWRAGRFCSATCFVAAQEDDSAARAGESTAVTRMREMFVYSELEQNLQAALAGDVSALEHAAALGDPQIEEVLAPQPQLG
jgi:hypothetical protein